MNGATKGHDSLHAAPIPRLVDEIWGAANALEDAAGVLEAVDYVIGGLVHEVTADVDTRDSAATGALIVMARIQTRYIEDLDSAVQRVYDIARRARESMPEVA